MGSISDRVAVGSARRPAARERRHLAVVREGAAPGSTTGVGATGRGPDVRRRADLPGWHPSMGPSEVPAVALGRAGLSRRGAGAGRPAAPLGGLVAPGPGQAPLRLTRRGRRVLQGAVVLAITLVVLLAVLLLGRPASAGGEAGPVRAERHLVQPGESLWDVAGAVAPDADRRDTVARIIDLNALSSSVVRPGQSLVVPPG